MPIDASLPVAELLATPEVRTLLGYTRRPLHFPDGYSLGLFSFSYSAEANWMFIVDCRDMTFERFGMPENGNGSHCAAMTPDGDVYFMPYARGKAYHFITHEKRFEEIAITLPENEYTWDAYGASNGRVYFGTYPNAVFGEFDPEKGTSTTWTKLRPETTYITNLREERGRIHFKAWGPAEIWLAFDPATREFSPSGPPTTSEQTAKTLPLPVGDQTYIASVDLVGTTIAVSNPSGRVWEITPESEPILVGNTGYPAETSWWLKPVDGKVAGVSYFGGMFLFDAKTRQFSTSHLNNRVGGGNSIMFLETISPDCVVGANYSQQNLFAIHPETGKVSASDTVIARTSGEPMCAIGLGGMAYIGIYVDSIVSRFDPNQMFEYGVNPKELICIGPEFEQTRPRAAATDGKIVYITSDSAYNKLGGALVAIDPETGKIDVYHHLIRDQNLPTLVYDRASGLLWGGTDRWGQMRSHPPSQPSALLYSFDPEARRVKHTIDLWPGSDLINVNAVTGNGLLVVSQGSEIALVDSRTLEVRFQGASPLANAQQSRLGSDGETYVLLEGVLRRWETKTNRLLPLAVCQDARFMTESAPGTWLFATPTSVYRVRLNTSTMVK
ncbi:MAG: hypothetical protein AMXMBFR84_21890 [Candidatus Hydrogenedentota bacterium]